MRCHVKALLFALSIALPLWVLADDAPEDKFNAEFRVPDKGSKILVMPAQTVDRAFAGGEKQVEQEILVQLEKAGYRPVALQGSKFEAYWPEIVRQVEATTDFKDRGTSVAFARAVGTMAKLATGDPEYALVVSPIIIVRVFNLHIDYASWDGVRRVPTGIRDGFKLWDFRWQGNEMGLSLQLVAFGEAGHWSFTSYGGLTLPGVANMNTGKITVRDDLFQDKGEIAEGVGIALRPLLKR